MTESTFLIVGLGNPGREYRENRHNIGFMLVDRLTEQIGISLNRVQFKALVGTGLHHGVKLILAKPQTFMNLSGQAVSALVRFYKLPLTNLLVAHDDLDLPFGTIRLRPGGGSAGQKGISSIIEKLGRQDFSRLRLGIDHPPDRMDPADYVLQNFKQAELIVLSEFLDRAAEAALVFVNEGLDAAMNKYNGQVIES